jgi:Spy/CpxP family protein refolding chaperone
LPHNPGHMEMFTRDLNLNPDQQNQIQAILNDTRARYAELHQKLDPEYEQVRHEGRQRIRQALTPEQRPKFEELLRQIDEDRRKRQAATEGHD